MATLPYITAPGNIEKALHGIKTAATPERVSQDFVKTILQIHGGSGDQVTSYLKKIGFTNQDGSPSDVYKKFRNPASSGAAASEALRIGYSSLYRRNEYMHQLSDEKLKGLIIEETGQGKDSSVVGLVLACIKAIKKNADWTQPIKGQDEINQPLGDKQLTSQDIPQPPPHPTGDLGLNLSYTINLNLPATSDIAVFNAIFKSLKDNLLRK